MGKGQSIGCGNSFANGQSVNNGSASPWSWRGGYEAPPPVNLYTLVEGSLDVLG